MPRLTLRPRLPDDLPLLWQWTRATPDPEWKQWDGPYFTHQSQPVPYETYRQQAESQPPQPHSRVIALDGTCIGQVTRFEEPPAQGGWWELGIVIYDPGSWGCGYGRDALQQWTTSTFDETDAHVLTLTTWSGNERMVRSAQRAGDRECGRIPEARVWQGRRWDSVKLAVLRPAAE
ncbi:GNAT family N-acetyltransferase (plasmid) [Deinococcus taeanensis]|uniref:GNAT family N-acetyltransferase n=1 Tax=Deinococcus taeanensis TaxID=2737050 RepID=UPI001CDCF83D|nr:GNAT family protein [Deinococcus taeanensis]UBV44248.1 GNAT family N-acetyltransferase [Deinococcus taeanensis]